MTRVFQWPTHLIRAVSSSFTLGSLNGSAQPLYQAKADSFADPFEQRWLATFTSPALGLYEDTAAGKFRPSYREVEGRVAALKGVTGFLRLYDPANRMWARDLEIVRAAAGGQSLWAGGSAWSGGGRWLTGLLPPSITVAEQAHAGARQLVVRGLLPSISRIARIGDRFEARPNAIPAPFGHYYIVTSDGRSNASGLLLLNFEPGLRAGLNVGDQIVIRNPRSVFNLIDDKQGVVERDLLTGKFGLSLIEVLPSDPV